MAELNDRLAEERFTRWKADYLADAGVPYSRVSLELLFLLPAGFIKGYKQLFGQALGPVDAGADARGRAAGRTGALGRAKGGARGGTGKRWKNLPLTIRDEDALELKRRIDTRLRSMGREIKEELRGMEEARKLDIKRKVEGRGEGEGSETGRCSTCHKFMAASWRWCPFCGVGIED